MKKQKISIQKRPLTRAVIMPLLFALCCFITVKSEAQGALSDQFSYDGDKKIRNITVPSGYNYVYLEAKGADGGNWGDYTGGTGALASGYFRVGTADGQIPPGATLRFIVGQKGGSGNYGGGGGGTGIAFKDASGAWQILLVGGGGGGSGDEGAGSGRGDIGGGGADGSRGSNDGAYGGFGYLSSLSSSGEPVGTDGRAGCDGCNSGGFGFGGGGSSVRANYNDGSGGGGGGYSGGHGGRVKGDDFYIISVPHNYYGGEGGSSYVNPDPKLLAIKFVKTFGRADSPQDGYASYQFTNEIPVKSIKFAANTTKCAVVKDANASGSTNVELASCQDGPTQNWILENTRIMLADNTSKCLEIYKNYNANGTNVQLYDCNDSPGQKWVYDVYRKIIRSLNDFNKCLDLVNGITTSGTNIQLYDCVSDVSQANQQWVIDGIPSKMPGGSNNKIYLEKYRNKCVESVNNGTMANGTNVQLNTCHSTNAQYLVFDNRYIRMQANTGKCLSLEDSGDANGNNIHLWDCKGKDNQKWVYDGFSKAFRSVVNINKCLSIEDSDAHDGTNIHLWDCKNNENQRFDLY